MGALGGAQTPLAIAVARASELYADIEYLLELARSLELTELTCWHAWRSSCREKGRPPSTRFAMGDFRDPDLRVTLMIQETCQQAMRPPANPVV